MKINIFLKIRHTFLVNFRASLGDKWSPEKSLLSDWCCYTYKYNNYCSTYVLYIVYEYLQKMYTGVYNSLSHCRQ